MLSNKNESLQAFGESPIKLSVHGTKDLLLFMDMGNFVRMTSHTEHKIFSYFFVRPLNRYSDFLLNTSQRHKTLLRTLFNFYREFLSQIIKVA